MADESTMMWCVGLLVVFLLFGGCCWCMCQRDESAPRAVGLRQRGVRRAKLMANPFATQEADEYIFSCVRHNPMYAYRRH